MNDLTDLKLQIIDINDRVRPIATHYVDVSDPNWEEKLHKAQKDFLALNESGFRVAVESLVESLIDEYLSGDEEERAHLRSLVGAYPHFCWVAAPPYQPTSAATFQRQVLWFSILDQGNDSRDALVTLESMVATGHAAGLNVVSVLSEVAELSSDDDRMKMGSTKSILLKAALDGGQRSVLSFS